MVDKETAAGRRAEQQHAAATAPQARHPAAPVVKPEAKTPVERSAHDNKSADAQEGVIRDPVMLGGQAVSYVKDIGVGDPEYDASVRKVMVQMPGGGTKVVAETEILRSVAPKAADALQADRDPTKTFPRGHPGDVTQSSTRADTVTDHSRR